jgi:hypothetical protein
MKPDDVNRAAGLAGEWVWLFPATYLAHIAEEYWGGEGFPRWISRVAGATLTTPEFLTLNAVAWVLMAGAMVGVVRGLWRWPLVAFGLVVLARPRHRASVLASTRSFHAVARVGGRAAPDFLDGRGGRASDARGRLTPRPRPRLKRSAG